MTTGFSFCTNATSEWVVPRSMPIGLGGALGSKISSSAMGDLSPFRVRGNVIFHFAHLFEEATVKPELAELCDQRLERGSARRATESSRQRLLGRAGAGFDLFRQA